MFYRIVYSKACNSFWELRPTFLFLALTGLLFIMLDIISGLIYIFDNKILLDVQDALFFFLVAVLLWLPAVGVVCRKNRGRSNNYLNFLREIKIERNLDNKAIDDLLEDISNLRIKYKNERDNLFNILLKISKIAFFPLTAAIFTGLIKDVNIAIFILYFLCMGILIFLLSCWIDNEILDDFRNLGIKNYYVISVD